MRDLPIVQIVPPYPVTQVHVYMFAWSMQVPACRQGWLAHSSMSVININETVIINGIVWHD